MKQILIKIQRHTAGAHIALLASLFIFALAGMVYSTGEDIHQRWLTDSTDYFIYLEPPVEIVGEITRGGDIKLHSNSYYKTDIRMEWYDTATCILEDGIHEKMQTQFWPDFKNEGATPEDEVWVYNKELVPNTAVACRVCGQAVAITDKGYDKPYEYCTEWQDVVQ